MSSSYGAVEGTGGSATTGPPDGSFDTSESYYLTNSTSSRTVTLRKFFLVAFPILIAALIVGGAALFLSRDFDRLYPGHGGSVEHAGGATRTDRPSSSSTASATRTKAKTGEDVSKSTVIGGSGACASHPVCATAGLIGDCCPTDEGIQLDCC
jgi:hypothetical protein